MTVRLLFLAAVVLLAGCSSPVAPPPESNDQTTGTSEPATTSQPAQVVVIEARSQEIYNFTGLLVDNLDATFEAPKGTVGLDFALDLTDTCAGSMQVEVVGPDGESAFHKTFDACAGPFTVSPPDEAQPGLGPGIYAVRYSIIGAIELDFRVQASVEGPAA